MPSPSVAVIDIGSNTIKLLVAARAPAGGLQTLTSETIDARISAGIGQAEPRLSEEGMTRGLAAVRELLTVTAPFSPVQTAIVATSAVRDAANGAEFCERLRVATGQPLRILSGDEEANLIGRGLTSDPTLAHLRDFYVFDLGGGSLECLAFRERRIQQACSLQLGCVRLTERFVADAAAPFSATARTAVADLVQRTLRDSGFRFDLTSGEAVFAGGSMTTARIIAGLEAGKALADTAPRVAVETLGRLLDRVAALPLAERRTHIPGLPAARADVFPTALATMIAVAEVARVSAFHHSFYNLRYGLAAELLEKLTAQPTGATTASPS
jgi:exopolyphosphatase/guanosine-5'-triphosphate,3'-diphosphate pyrophosphatase